MREFFLYHSELENIQTVVVMMLSQRTNNDNVVLKG